MERQCDGVSGNGGNIGGRFGRDGMRFGWNLMAKGWGGIWFMTLNHIGLLHVVKDVVEPFLLSLRNRLLIDLGWEDLFGVDIDLVFVPVNIEDFTK